MSAEFENGTDNISDMQQRLDLFMSTCQRCGRCFPEPSIIERLKMKGYRADELDSERWMLCSRAFLQRDPAVDDINIELE